MSMSANRRQNREEDQKKIIHDIQKNKKYIKIEAMHGITK